MLITKRIEIDAGHRVFNHKSKCFSPHGHRYFIEVGIDDKIIKRQGTSSEGMVIDFGDVKEILMEEIDKVYDHSFIICDRDYLMRFMLIDSKLLLENSSLKKEIKSVVPYYGKILEQIKSQNRPLKVVVVNFVPTAENLAKHWYRILKIRFNKKGIKLCYVKVWETPNSTALYNGKE